MSIYFIVDTTLSGIANAIREKLGVATTYKPTEMSDAILSIPTGGSSVACGDFYCEEKTVSYVIDTGLESVTEFSLVSVNSLQSTGVKYGYYGDGVNVCGGISISSYFTSYTMSSGLFSVSGGVVTFTGVEADAKKLWEGYRWYAN